MRLYSEGEYAAASLLFQEATAFKNSGESGTEKQTRTPCQSDNHLNAPPVTSYTFQPMVFDEGMMGCTHTERVEKCDSAPLVVQAKLLFNAGQARRKLEDFVEASQYYKEAYETIVAGQNDGNSSKQKRHRVMIPILQNIGQLAYREGKLQTGHGSLSTRLGVLPSP